MTADLDEPADCPTCGEPLEPNRKHCSIHCARVAAQRRYSTSLRRRDTDRRRYARKRLDEGKDYRPRHHTRK